MSKSPLRRPEELWAEESFGAWSKGEMLPEQALRGAEARMMERIAGLEPGSGPVPDLGPWPGVSRSRGLLLTFPARRAWLAAASVVLLAVSVWAVRHWLFNRPTLTTDYGQITAKVLPDGTEVTLNANSSLQYADNWVPGKDREVWMKGEVFFHVRKTPARDRFIVHSDGFDVIVTGTSFNVVDRDWERNVVLEEGHVKVLLASGKSAELQPGDAVELMDSGLVKMTIRPGDATAWLEKKIVFDNTPISQVIKEIEGHYGVTVRVADTSLLTRTVSAILPNNDLDVLLKALEATTEFKITRNGDTILIQGQ